MSILKMIKTKHETNKLRRGVCHQQEEALDEKFVNF